MAQALEAEDIAAAAKQHRLAPLPQQCSANDVVSVWDYISQYVEKQMGQGKGVVLPGLGSFTFSRKQLDVGNGHIVVQRPVFLLSEKLHQMYNLSSTRHFTSGDIPVSPLNFSSVALDSPYSRDLVQTCYHVIASAIPRAVQANKKIDLVFAGIGRLLIIHGHVKMKFFKEFVNSLDSSGNIEKVIRFDTRGTRSNPSIMSGAVTRAESRTASTLTLPRIATTASSSQPVTGQLPAVQEEVVDSAEKGKKEKEENHPTGEFGLPQHETDTSRVKLPQAAQGNSPRLSKSSPPQSRPSTCSHSHAGQELCYLCHQRAVTNVPVTFAKEIRRQEQVENQLLFEYQKRQDEIAIAKDRARSLQARKFAEQTSHYNWGVAKEKMEIANRHPKDEYQPSFLMRNRPPSPPYCLQQTAYKQELQSQLTEKLQRLADARRDREMEERLQRIQQAERIQASHLAYLQKKKQEREDYQQALAHQLENKPEQLPRFEPDSEQPIFGSQQRDREKWLEGKAAAKEVMEDQLAQMERKRYLEEKRVVERKEKELAALERTKRELVEDNLQQGVEQQQREKELIASWQVEAVAKRQRDRADEADHHHPSTYLLHQCQQYHRCKQCQRRKDAGAGTTHVVKDTRYIAGCNMIV